MFHIWNQAFRIIGFLGWCPNMNPAWWWEQCEGCLIWPHYINRWASFMIITPSSSPFSAVFSNQRFNNCSSTMDVVFVKLLSDCFVETASRWILISAVTFATVLLWFIDTILFNVRQSILLSFGFRPLFLLADDVLPWFVYVIITAALIHLINWPFSLQMLQLNVYQQFDHFENLVSLPFFSTFIQTVTKHNL